MVDLTVVILTKNEEANLRKCVESFRGIAKRFVVVDSYSTDATVELAKSLGAEVYQHSFKNHAAQFNWALENTEISTQWVMKIDADEELTIQLAEEINNRLESLDSEINGIILRRRVYFMGRWLRHGGKYPELLLRIFKVGHGMSEMKMMDEHLIIKDGSTVMFRYDFIDNNNKNLEWWIHKHNWYSNKEVFDYQLRNMKLNGRSAGYNTFSLRVKLKRFVKNYGYYSLPKFLRAHIYFLYRYFIRLGFLDGREGLIYTFLQAYWYRFLVDAKLYECEKNGIRMKNQEDLKA